MQPTQFENTCGRVFRTIRFEKKMRKSKKILPKKPSKKSFQHLCKIYTTGSLGLSPGVRPGGS